MSRSFGKGTFGVEAASRRFFHKPASRLTLSEAALLAAVLPNPAALPRRRTFRLCPSTPAWILRQMRQLGGEGFLQRNHLN
ncbi:transglycosylase domain-containing protein [Pantoea ananatis]